jgi:hypothetical protein
MPKNYTIFGKVIKGMDVVAKIGNVDIIPGMGPTDGRPKEDVVMKTVTVSKQPTSTKGPKPNPHVWIEVVRREPAPAADSTAGKK